MTARELDAPLVTAAGTPIRGETLTIATVCEVFIPDDDFSSRGFEGYRGVTANRGRVRLRGAHEARDAAYGTATHEVWERTEVWGRRDWAQLCVAGDETDGRTAVRDEDGAQRGLSATSSRSRSFDFASGTRIARGAGAGAGAWGYGTSSWGASRRGG